MNDPPIEDEIDKALAARHSGNFEAAKQILTRLAANPKTSEKWVAFCCNELGYIATLQGDDVVAEVHLRRAVELRPRVEIVSLQLFHVLRRRHGIDAAVGEALRFVSASDSPEYRELFSEAYCNALPARVRGEAHAVREILEKRGRAS